MSLYLKSAKKESYNLQIKIKIVQSLHGNYVLTGVSVRCINSQEAYGKQQRIVNKTLRTLASHLSNKQIRLLKVQGSTTAHQAETQKATGWIISTGEHVQKLKCILFHC